MAQTTVNDYGPARGSARIVYPANADTPGYMSNAGETLSVNSLPSELAAVALGNTWQTSIPTGSAYSNLYAYPTTRSELFLKNNYGSGSGVIVAIRSVWWASLTTVAASSTVTIFGQIVASSATAVTDNAACLITSQSGKASYGGSVQRAVADASTYAVASRWQVLGSMNLGATTSVGAGFSVPIKGGLILPPGAILCLNTAVVATGTSLLGIVWDEYVYPVG